MNINMLAIGCIGLALFVAFALPERGLHAQTAAPAAWSISTACNAGDLETSCVAYAVNATTGDIVMCRVTQPNVRPTCIPAMPVRP